MRAVWLDAGNNPNPVQLDKHEIKTTLWPADAAFTTAEHIDAWRDSYSQGFYVAQHWGDWSPGMFASVVSTYVHNLGGDERSLVVHVDIELHDPSYMVTFLSAWRKLRPTRPTWWTLEGFQGGWFTPQLMQAINADAHLNLLPQAFAGDMTPFDVDAVRSNLVNVGVTRGRVAPCYDAARVGEWWDGLAFTQGRLKS